MNNACVVEKSPAVKRRERREALARSLAKVSQAASFFSLQAKHDHVEVVVDGLPEMKQLLTACEEQLGGSNESVSFSTAS